MIIIKGVDISHHNYVTSFKELSENVDFIIVRAGYGDTAKTDRKFMNHIKEIIKYKIPVGFYWFLYGDTIRDMENNAMAFYKTVLPYMDDIIEITHLNIPLFYADWEYDSDNKVYGALSKSKRSSLIECFCENMEELLKRECGVYLNYDYYNNKVNGEIKNRKIWWASYNRLPVPEAKNEIELWQWTSTGKVPGIKGNVDINVVFDNVIIPTKNLKISDEGLVVKNLQHKLNIILDSGLKEDGVFGFATMNEVKKYQNKFGLHPDGIVGYKTIQSMYLK